MSVIPQSVEALRHSKFGVRYPKLRSAPTPYLRTFVPSYGSVFDVPPPLVSGPVVSSPWSRGQSSCGPWRESAFRIDDMLRFPDSPFLRFP